MKQNLITIAGLSHSGKDLLFNQLMKLGRAEPNLRIFQNVVYYDWLKPSSKVEEEYLNAIFPVVKEKILQKVNTLIYIHDISYQRLDDIVKDFKDITYEISKLNKKFQVILLLNRGHLIQNDVERTKLKNSVLARLQQIFPEQILTYIVSLKGSDEQRLTNLVFTQIINKASDFSAVIQSQAIPSLNLKDSQINKIKEILNQKMNNLQFAGGYLLSPTNDILLAVGKSSSWQDKIGPQIIRMLDQSNAFEISSRVNTNVFRIEDFLMVTHMINEDLKLVLLGRDSTFTLFKESFKVIEQHCLEIAESIISKLK